MAEKEFWMVWRENSTAPTFRHQGESAARREAVRLARNLRGQKFYLLRATESFLAPPSDILSEKLEEDEVPF